MIPRPERYKRNVAMTLTSRLSEAAIRHVETLECGRSDVIAARLYAFHRFPTTLAWRALFASGAATAKYLGIARHPSLRRDWSFIDIASNNWFAWRRAGPDGDAESRFKLYVSPHCSDLPEVLASAIQAFTEGGATAFKVGTGADGIVRPDKLIGYFPDMKMLDRTAGILTNALAGARAHGVPFTCQLDLDGVLSWGVDPPKFSLSGDTLSWRQWITQYLARWMLEDGRTVASRSASDHALRRLQQAGVDVTTWTPVVPIWTATVDG